ncbi:unnamed protein product [Paramecium primaurelia]|uniref:Uncharacterized protein n=1 Tax=Paramecium primaurelia TaxID=5886 RepID=A0A8S1JZE8_PARPR|nr:unnamed protein product [Paramecium primaurelia]
MELSLYHEYLLYFQMFLNLRLNHYQFYLILRKMKIQFFQMNSAQLQKSMWILIMQEEEPFLIEQFQDFSLEIRDQLE